MREYQSCDIRNIALVGHSAAGKTMITESMLACSGIINRLGRVTQGNTTSDFHEEEQKHNHSIYTSLLHAEWDNKKINILDTPGYADFVGETLGALHVADLAVFVINSENGIELGTENAWEYSTNYGLANIFLLNALDKENINFDNLLSQLRSRFGNHVIPLTAPANVGPGFNQILDILNKKIITYKGDEIGTSEIKDLSEETKNYVDKLHQELIECLAESDTDLLEKFFEKGSLDANELNSALHKALKNKLFIPAFATSGEKNIGIAPLMNFISKYGIAPTDRENLKVLDEDDKEINITLSDTHPSMFIFKTLSESKSGGLSIFKVTSGNIKTGLNLYNSTKKTDERVGQLFVLNGKNRIQLELLHPGDIGAVAKLKDSHTNNTLSDPDRIITYSQISYPHPNIHIAVKPKVKGQEEKLVTGLTTIHEEDLTFSHKVDSELHQILIAGSGELHLEMCVEKLRNRFGLDIETYKPHIAYRETIKARGESKYRHKKQSGGAGQFAEVWMRIEPKGHDDEVEFTQSLVGQNVDRVFVPSVEKGVKTACQKGALAGYKVVGVKVDFYDGKQHPVDSKDIAFQIAGMFAFKEAFLNARPCLLEPIMLIAVKVPDDFTGAIMSDLSGRRGKILGIETEGRFTVVKAHVPQAELYRYSTTLRSIVGGRGVHTETFSHYEELPHEFEKHVIEQSKSELTESANA
jgi:elongation factor G